MSSNVVPFNPLDKQNLGASVAEALLDQEAHPLECIPEFTGAGIYAIYYSGDFLPYKQMARVNKDQFLLPIYVGKAVPAGSRVGLNVDENVGRPLFRRLREHRSSIEQAENLQLSDFYYRFLVVDSIWIPLGESLMIARFAPLWNSHIAGFGNHNPGKGRHAGMRSRWDVLHPGRPWVENLRERPETAETIAREAFNYLKTLPPFLSN